MKPCLVLLGLLLSGVSLCSGCGGGGGWEPPGAAGSATRRDAAHALGIGGPGSRQNPAWSPAGDALVFTRFLGGYNRGPARLERHRLSDGQATVLVADGSENVNLPGSSWSAATNRIVFSSSRDPHDEIWSIAADGAPGSEVRLTSRSDRVAFEPSWTPDGTWIVFESHLLDVEGNGVLTRYKLDGTAGYQALTAATDDARQPNWSPDGQWIVYQRQVGGRWDVWLMGSDGSNPHALTSGPGNKTDPSFSPNSRWVVYSAEGAGWPQANLFAIPVAGGTPVRLTDSDAYDGAPSWSPDGRRILFESSPGDPDGSAGTRILVLDDVPAPAGG